MTGSTMPLEVRLSGHPVHRATELLRDALYSSTTVPPDAAEIWAAPIYRLEPAPLDLDHGPVGLTGPDALTALLGFSPFEPCPEREPFVTDKTDAEVRPAAEGDHVPDRAVQVQLRGLVDAFHQRQRQANRVVAFSIAAALLLTLGGLILLFSTIGPASSDGDRRSSKAGGAPDRHAEMPVPRPASIPVRAASGNAGDSVIEARPGQTVALGGALPLGSARYILLRGLPEDAALSSGRRAGPGAWMVRAADVAGLTLTLSDNAGGDYPTELYLLGSEQGLEARREMLLRVDPSPQVYAAGLELGWPTVFSAMPAIGQPEPAAAPDAASAAAEVHDRVQHLLTAGEIAGARHLLQELAERGEANAAYELALTYDDEVLVKAGLGEIGGDSETAEAWYARAATHGHAAAARRLDVLVRRRAGV
jgi:hypothetical protein